MRLIISLAICIIVCLFLIIPFIKKYKKSNNNLKEFLRYNKYEFVCIIIIFFACTCRTFFIDKLPYKFHQDEASIGYEAYSILNYGIGRNGESYPVHLISWGSGQNTLYMYILIPFIKILGLSVFSVRLPMTIIGCISIIVWYYLLKSIMKYNKKFIIILLILSFLPYHFLKSRWALESNLFPDMILYATFFIRKYFDKSYYRYLYLASFFIGISAYTYGTSYIFLPIYCIILAMYLLKKKNMKIKKILICASIVFVIVFPMILFTVVNCFDLETIHLGKITIPKMILSRLHENNLGNKNIVLKLIINLIYNFNVVSWGLDSSILNNTFLTILVNIALFILFLVYLKKYKNEEKKLLDEIMYVWLIAALITVLFFSLRGFMNINRVNIIWFPIAYFAIKSIINIDIKYGMAVLDLICIFIMEYFTIYNVNLKFVSKNEKNLYKAIDYVQSFEKDEKCYIDDNIINDTYIYYLFYTKLDPNYYISNVDKEYKLEINGIAEIVSRIGNVYFYVPEKTDGIIITTKDRVEDFGDKNVKEFGNIVVLCEKIHNRDVMDFFHVIFLIVIYFDYL